MVIKYVTIVVNLITIKTSLKHLQQNGECAGLAAARLPTDRTVGSSFLSIVTKNKILSINASKLLKLWNKKTTNSTRKLPI